MKKFALIFALTAVLYGCLEIEEASIIPEIELLNFDYQEGIDSLLGNPVFYIRQQISFVDGDGDVGSTDSLDKQLFVTPLKMINGVIGDTLDTLTFNIPYIEPVKTVRYMNGEIENIFYLTELGGFQQNDTITFETYIMDRSGHKSNIITTKKGDFIFKFEQTQTGL